MRTKYARSSARKGVQQQHWSLVAWSAGACDVIGGASRTARDCYADDVDNRRMNGVCTYEHRRTVTQTRFHDHRIRAHAHTHTHRAHAHSRTTSL